MCDNTALIENEGTEKKFRISRRKAIATASGISAIGLIGVASGGREDRINVPMTISGGKIVRTMSVPRKWHNQAEATERRRTRLSEDYSDKSWFDFAGQAADYERSEIGGLHPHKITVYSNNVSKAEEELSDNIDGSRVKVKETPDVVMDNHLDNACDEHTSGYKCVPGGSYLTLSDEYNCWSACCQAEDNKLLTSAHPLGNCGDDLTNKTVESGSGGRYSIGEVVNYDHDHDVALIDTSGSVNGIDNTVLEKGDYELVGASTSKHIDKLISENETVEHVGISTGHDYGSPTERLTRSFPHCNDDEVEAIKVTTNAGSGDSGGPHFWTDDEWDQMNLLGVHTVHSSTQVSHARSWGPAGYAINDTVGWKVGSTEDSC